MNAPATAWITRRSLYQGRLFEIGQVICRPTPDLRHEVEYAALNVLALPTAGIFALHPSARRHVVATPNHAVFISSGRPYRVTFPGCIGDECLTLRLTAEGLAACGADVVSAVFRNALQQLVVPDSLRGRLASLNILVVTGGPRLGDLEGGLVASAFTPTISVVSGGLLCLVGVAVIATTVPRFARWRVGDPP